MAAEADRDELEAVRMRGGSPIDAQAYVAPPATTHSMGTAAFVAFVGLFIVGTVVFAAIGAAAAYRYAASAAPRAISVAYSRHHGGRQ